MCYRSSRLGGSELLYRADRPAELIPLAFCLFERRQPLLPLGNAQKLLLEALLFLLQRQPLLSVELGKDVASLAIEPARGAEWSGNVVAEKGASLHASTHCSTN